MSKKFVRKIIGVKKLQDLRDYTNEIGDIVIKDGIHAYIRTEDEYKPISYPMIWDYGVDSDDKTRADMHVNATGIHALDTKKDTSRQYDLTNENINETKKIVKDDKTIADTDEITSNGISHTKQVSNSYERESITDVSYEKSITLATDPTFHEAFNFTDKFMHQVTCAGYSDQISISGKYEKTISCYTNDGELMIDHAWTDSYNLFHNVTMGDGAINCDVGNKDTRLELNNNGNGPITLSAYNNLKNGVMIGSKIYDSSNKGIIEFLVNDKKLQLIAQYDETNNTYDFKIRGDSEIYSKFVTAVDNMLGFTATINGLKQRISSLESRVTSLENR